MIEGIRFFDCNSTIGQGRTPGTGCSVGALIAEMDHWEIDKALVCHALPEGLPPSSGNQELLRKVEHQERLVLCWVIGDRENPETLLRDLRAYGIRAVRMFPFVFKHRSSLQVGPVGPLLDALEEAEVPLILDFDLSPWEEPQLDALYDVCEALPRLKVVLIRIGAWRNRGLFPLLNQFGNLYLEISGCPVGRELENLSRNGWAYRLLFGTGMPAYTPERPIEAVMRSDLLDEARRFIAGGNLERILKVY